MRRIVDGRRADTVQRLLDAAVEEVRTVDFRELSVRSVAKRADVSPATAYTYFASKEHLVSAVVWQKLRDLPSPRRSPNGPGPADLARTVRAIAGLFSAEPELSRACTTALLADDPEVRRLRDQIGMEIAGRLQQALGPVDGTVSSAVSTAFVGSLVLAGVGYLSFDQLADELARIAEMLLAGQPLVTRSRRTRQR
ncbi:MAG TPA: TetR/AcrR family transcriptional regulator [Rugosimonospora sp.]|nr:TetR/AcrR family transcriptional regulator [Rugosimonospora sp.]